MFPRKVTRGVMLPLADGEIALQPAEAVFSLGKTGSYRINILLMY